MCAVNLRFERCDVRVDRQTRWGNPFRMHGEADRPLVVARYRQWLWGEITAGRVSKKDLAELHGKKLGCWCAPAACHGDVLTAAAQWAVAGAQHP